MHFAVALATLASTATLALAQVRTGQATFYTPSLGVCGHQNTVADIVVAIDAVTFDNFPGAGADPASNPICGKTVTANFGGASVTATVVDRCPVCKENGLDFSPAAFEKLAPIEAGLLKDVTWSFD